MDPQLRFLDALRSGTLDLTFGEVSDLVARYPFFSLPAALLLKQHRRDDGLTPEQVETLRRVVALNAPNQAEMMKLIDPDGERWSNFYPVAPVEEKSTDDIIDTFITNYGHIDEKENALLERLIFNPTPDYAQMLEREAAADTPDPTVTTGNEQDDRINAFIAKNTPSSPSVTPPTPEPEKAASKKPRKAPKQAAPQVPEATGSFSESLAKIYVRQQKFAKAYEIIANLSRNNPDGNRFYDDQLRFLRKAIIARGGTPPTP